MILLILIAVAQLVVMVFLLGVVLLEITRREIERATAAQTVSRLERRTVGALFEAASTESADRQDRPIRQRRSP